jgi:hypothetical protein
MDLDTSDTTKLITRRYVYQVNSSSASKIYYLIIRGRLTTYLFILCRITEDMYVPRVKMRVKIASKLYVSCV